MTWWTAIISRQLYIKAQDPISDGRGWIPPSHDVTGHPPPRVKVEGGARVTPVASQTSRRADLSALAASAQIMTVTISHVIEYNWADVHGTLTSERHSKNRYRVSFHSKFNRSYYLNRCGWRSARYSSIDWAQLVHWRSLVRDVAVRGFRDIFHWDDPPLSQPELRPLPTVRGIAVFRYSRVTFLTVNSYRCRNKII